MHIRSRNDEKGTGLADYNLSDLDIKFAGMSLTIGTHVLPKIGKPIEQRDISALKKKLVVMLSNLNDMEAELKYRIRKKFPEDLPDMEGLNMLLEDTVELKALLEQVQKQQSKFGTNEKVEEKEDLRTFVREIRDRIPDVTEGSAMLLLPRKQKVNSHSSHPSDSSTVIKADANKSSLSRGQSAKSAQSVETKARSTPPPISPKPVRSATSKSAQSVETKTRPTPPPVPPKPVRSATSKSEQGVNTKPNPTGVSNSSTKSAFAQARAKFEAKFDEDANSQRKTKPVVPQKKSDAFLTKNFRENLLTNRTRSSGSREVM